MQLSPHAGTAAERRRAVLDGMRRSRTTQSALAILQRRGVTVRVIPPAVQRPPAAPGPATQVRFVHGSTTGVWTDRHAPAGHEVDFESVPPRIVPALIRAVTAPPREETAGHDQPLDAHETAAQYLHRASGGLLSGTHWSVLPCGSHTETAGPTYAEEFEADPIGVAHARVHLSGPGMDDPARVEIQNLTEPCARRLMQTYATLIITTPTA